MTKKEKWPQKKMGLHCGYDLYEDGSIKAAPRYVDALKQIATEREALNALLKVVTEQCHRLLIPITERSKRTWDDLQDDYGLDCVGMTIELHSGIIRKITEQPNA